MRVNAPFVSSSNFIPGLPVTGDTKKDTEICKYLWFRVEIFIFREFRIQ